MSLPADVAGAPIPRDARIIALIMYSMGITDADPAVLLQLLEFANRYTHDVLQDALVYSDHAATTRGGGGGGGSGGGGGHLSLEDIQLAIQSRVNYSFTHPPPKDVLVSLASSINAIPLPPISDRVGVRLPPLEHCLTNVNFSIVPNSPPRSRSPSPPPPPPSSRSQAAIKREAAGPSHANGHERDDGDEGMADVSSSDAVASQPSAPSAGATAPDGVTLRPPSSTSRRPPGGEDDNYDDEPAPTLVPPSSANAAPSQPAPEPSRGTKRALDEDDEYD